MSNVDGRVHVVMLVLCLRFRLAVVSGVMILTHASGLDSSWVWSQLYSSNQRHYTRQLCRHEFAANELFYTLHFHVETNYIHKMFFNFYIDWPARKVSLTTNVLALLLLALEILSIERCCDNRENIMRTYLAASDIGTRTTSTGDAHSLARSYIMLD